MKTENIDLLRQELRLAQLEIKVLREQLLKSVQEAQRVREKLEAQASTTPDSPAPAEPSPSAESVIIPLSRHESSGNHAEGQIGRAHV